MVTTAMAYRDTFAYRQGREQSVVVQTWLSSFKSKFLHMVRNEKSKTGLKYNLDEVIYGSGYTAQIVVNQLGYWLTTDEGVSFLEQAFGMTVYDKDPTRLRGRMAEYWLDEMMSFMSNVIYRYDDTMLSNPSIEKKDIDAIHDGSPETAEIVADTMIGWLNSSVGRYFVKRVFLIPISDTAPDGSE